MEGGDAAVTTDPRATDSRVTDPAALVAQMGWVRSLARELARDAHEADELVQDAWVAALRTRPDRRAGSLRAWFAKVLRNAASQRARAERRRRDHEREAARDEASGDGDAVSRWELQRRLADAVAELSEPYRTAVILRHLDGWSARRIARHSGCSEAAARQRVSRGLAKLRERLEREAGGRDALGVALVPLIRSPSAPPGGVPVPLTTALAETMAAKSVLVPAAVVAGACVVGAVWWSAAGAKDSVPRPDERAGARPELAEASELSRGADDARSTLESGAVPSVVDAGPVSLLLDVDRERDLHGRVLYPSGEPASGAVLELTQQTWRAYSMLDLEESDRIGFRESHRTNELGEFKFPLEPARPYDLVARAEGWAPAVAASCSAGEYVELVLEPGAVFEGRIVADEDDGPIADVPLRGWMPAHDHWTAFEGSSGSDGSFRFDGLPPGRLRVEIMPPRHAPPFWHDTLLEAGTTTTHEFRCRPGYRLTGQVTDASTGAPIAGATVGQGWTFDKPVTTDVGGRYVMEGFAEDGVYEVAVRAPGYGGAIRPLPTGSDELVLDIALQPGQRLVGRVQLPDGSPASGAYVAAVASSFVAGDQQTDWRSGQVRFDGSFELSDLRGDLHHALLVRHAGHAVVAYDLPPRARGQQVFDVGTIVLQAPAGISGSVVDERGEPLAGVELELRVDQTDRARFAEDGTDRLDSYVNERETRTDDLGRYAFGQLPAGEVTLSVRPEGHPAPVRRTVSVPAGEIVEDVELVVAAGLSLTGRVVDPDGAPVPDVFVSLLAMQPSEQPPSAQFTNARGRFEFHGLEDHAYRLELQPWVKSRTDAPVAVVGRTVEDVRAGGPELELALERGERIAGRVLAADGGPAASLAVVALGPDGEQVGREWTGAEGDFAFYVEPGLVVDVLVFPPAEEGTVFYMQETSPEDAAARENGVAAGTSGLVLQLED